jgi:hypothetical protein
MAKSGNRLPAIADVIRGSCVVMKRTCGYDNCRCTRGYKHRSIYVSQYDKGSPRMIYIPKENEHKARRLVENYKTIKEAIYKASEANLKRLRQGKITS